MATPKSYYCERCKRVLKATEFYKTNDAEKYPDLILKQCKKCITAHVDNFNPETFLWILKECDVPYVPREWEKTLLTWGKDRSKLTGTTILGRYLAKMYLNQYKEYRWKDTEFLQEVEDAKVKETMKRQGYEAAEIAQALDDSRTSGFVIDDIQDSTLEAKYDPPPENNPNSALQLLEQPEQEDYFAIQSGGENDFVDDLTEEDRTYLRLKWGKVYRPEQWVKLEQLYTDMMGSYDIHSAGHIDTLKLICKTSLKANELIDIGDVEGFQKMSKVYDSLMKSGNFTAHQNKEEHGNFIDSLGELVEICESQGYIEKFYIEKPNDKVDLTIADMQRYTRTLIQEETNLNILLETAIRQNQKEDEEAANNKENEIIDDTDLSLEELEKTIRDQDYIDYEEFLDEAEAADEEYLREVDQ